MQYKLHVIKITEALKTYMGLINDLEKKYLKEVEEQKKKVEEMNGVNCNI